MIKIFNQLPNVARVISIGKTFVLTHRPQILFGAAITGTVTTSVLAARGGYEARGRVEEVEQGRKLEERLRADAPFEPLTLKEKATLTWTCYLPAAGSGIATVGAISGLHLVHVQEKKALAQAALAATEELKHVAKTLEQGVIITEDEKEALMEGRADENGVVQATSADGHVEELYLVRDARTGRDIWSNRNRIETAIVDINNHLNGQGEIDLNTFYGYAGFNAVPDGNIVGWNGALVELGWTTTTRDDGRPVAEFAFRPTPEEGYDSLR